MVCYKFVSNILKFQSLKSSYSDFAYKLSTEATYITCLIKL